MKGLPLSAIAAAAILAVGSPNLASAQTAPQNDGAASSKPEIVKRTPNGRAEVVRIQGKEYDVCTAQKQDSCINPRDAGLKWGNRAIGYWPGKPASEINGPLPAKQPS